MLETIDRISRIINGELKAEHVFCSTDGYQIIDWQRFYHAPGDIDLALLLESQQIPAEKYVSPSILELRWFLFIHWAVGAMYERCRQLLEMLRSEQNRLYSASASMRNDIEQHIDWLKKRLGDTDKDLTHLIRCQSSLEGKGRPTTKRARCWEDHVIYHSRRAA